MNRTHTVFYMQLDIFVFISEKSVSTADLIINVLLSNDIVSSIIILQKKVL